MPRLPKAKPFDRKEKKRFTKQNQKSIRRINKIMQKMIIGTFKTKHIPQAPTPKSQAASIQNSNTISPHSNTPKLNQSLQQTRTRPFHSFHQRKKKQRRLPPAQPLPSLTRISLPTTLTSPRPTQDQQLKRKEPPKSQDPPPAFKGSNCLQVLILSHPLTQHPSRRKNPSSQNKPPFHHPNSRPPPSHLIRSPASNKYQPSLLPQKDSPSPVSGSPSPPPPPRPSSPPPQKKPPKKPKKKQNKEVKRREKQHLPPKPPPRFQGATNGIDPGQWKWEV